MPKKRIRLEEETRLIADSDEETGGGFGRQEMPLQPNLFFQIIARIKRFFQERRASHEVRLEDVAPLVAGQESLNGNVFKYAPLSSSSSSTTTQEEQPSLFPALRRRHLVGGGAVPPSEKSNTEVVKNPFRERIVSDVRNRKKRLLATATHSNNETEQEEHHNRSDMQNLL